MVDEDDLIHAVYRGDSIRDIVVSQTEWIDRYNRLCKYYDLNESISYTPAYHGSMDDFVGECLNNWTIPEEYKTLDVDAFVIDKCTTKEETERVVNELAEFKNRKMINLLRFLIYFVDTMKSNNQIWGVGRGSSVASYVLYLIGVHKVDSLKYDLDITEFLK